MPERSVAIFAGGGTGGHLYPALVLADELVRQRPSTRPFFLGAQGGLEARLLPERKLEHCLLPVRGFQRGELLSNIGVPCALTRSLAVAIKLFRQLDPELVVVTGGYAGAPAGIATAMAGIPLVLQEQNAWPGATTRFLSRWATQVHVAFPESVQHLPLLSKDSIHVSGCPIRIPQNQKYERHDLCMKIGLDPGLKVILMVGGSQGSLALNDLMKNGIRSMTSGSLSRLEGWQLLWVTGTQHHTSVDQALSEMGSPGRVRTVPYIEDMPSVLSIADLAISRAGAMTTAELMAWGVPSILIPLPTSAANHQEMNAQALQNSGAAIHLSQEGLTPESLWISLEELTKDQDLLERMRHAARARSNPEAATVIVSEIIRLLPGFNQDVRA